MTSRGPGAINGYPGNSYVGRGEEDEVGGLDGRQNDVDATDDATRYKCTEVEGTRGWPGCKCAAEHYCVEAEMIGGR